MKFMVVIAFALLALVDAQCPSDGGAIAPCICTEDILGRLILECRSLDSEEQLGEVFLQEFPDKAFYNLYIDQSPGIRTLTDNLFNGATFQILEIYGTSLELIAENALVDSLDILERIIIKESLLDETSFLFSNLSTYTALVVLTIDDSNVAVTQLPALHAYALENLVLTDGRIDSAQRAGNLRHMPLLKSINLERNGLRFLDAGVFEETQLLQSVSLSENNITNLVNATFFLPNAPISIYLWNNDIDTIEPGAFFLPENTDSLSLFLDIGENNLLVIDEAVFAELFPIIDFLFIAGNPLVCGCDIAWLVTNPDWVGKIGNTAECADGVRIVDLDPQYYTDNC